MDVYGADLDGINGTLIRFSATVDEKRKGGVTILGLAQKVVKEGYARSRKAIETLQGNWAEMVAAQGYTIDLYPPETPKNSSGLDLPIAIMLLHASLVRRLDTLKAEIGELERRLRTKGAGVFSPDQKKRLLEGIESRVRQRKRILKYQRRLQQNKRKYLLIGTLNIVDGSITTPLYGMFGMIAAAKPGFTVIVPEDSEVYASIVGNRKKDVQTLKAASLEEVWNVILGLQRGRRTREAAGTAKAKWSAHHVPDLRDIKGVARAKRAMTVALAGGHNILLVGPKGQGKTMLSRAATELLPDLTRKEMFDLHKIYSAKGDLQDNEVIIKRPFRSVQNATEAALFGGGSRPPVPGEVSLAHEGVLLIDEINQLERSLLMKLRTTLSERIQRVQRVHSTLEFPCNFILVASMNPCRCGWYGHYVCPECGERYLPPPWQCPHHPRARLSKVCRCTPGEIRAFLGKLSEPFLDRIDLKVFVSSKDRHQGDPVKYASSTIKRKITRAREIQRRRYGGADFGDCNGSVPDSTQLAKYTTPIPSHVTQRLVDLFRTINSIRMQVKVLLVSRTVADLAGSKAIRWKDVSEAVDLMGIRHQYFRDLTGEP